MDTSTDHGLTVIYDEEAGMVTFEWDNETHPEYNYLRDLTEDGLADIVQNYLKKLDDEKNQAANQAGGSGSGTTES